jgi:hypothetical protein
MNNILRKTLGGLTTQYYLRQLFFGVLLAIILYFPLTVGYHGIDFGAVFILGVTALMYPYSRYVYESVISLITGSNVFYLPAFFLLLTKVLTMSLCFAFAPIVAPIGLALLFFQNSKAQK